MTSPNDRAVSRRTRLGLVGLAVVLTLGVAAACTDDGSDVSSGSASGSGSGSGSASGSTADAECEAVGDDLTPDTEVAVTLEEFSVTADPDEVAAGNIELEATNDGTEAHELVVVKGAPGDIELGDAGVDEDALGDDALLGEIEPFPADSSCNGTFALEAGEYTLLCNIVEQEEDGTVVSHVAEGMITPFTVTG
jgi:hypothetical protein